MGFSTDFHALLCLEDNSFPGTPTTGDPSVALEIPLGDLLFLDIAACGCIGPIWLGPHLDAESSGYEQQAQKRGRDPHGGERE